ncbi:25S rRNA (cytosine-C(5))-methyltransferase rcm1 [Porphyridium purpureum]|uniref:25S rRNA (Cytosine-C(5))-methyltransferase rcm1 n=1 Tax=Porphyridium purpureum TaxID=35688 RepID=A0A5J4Z5E8_PORPP|nr:25S rRNA (cytosine-C(5))-methyltransferase rcm1 [Porphyridium purpureum]|eukprot:POR7488..scf295_1
MYELVVAAFESVRIGTSASLRSALYAQQAACGSEFRAVYALALEFQKADRSKMAQVLPNIQGWARAEQTLALVLLFELVCGAGRVRMTDKSSAQNVLPAFHLPQKVHDQVRAMGLTLDGKEVKLAVQRKFGSFESARRALKQPQELAALAPRLRFARWNGLAFPDGVEQMRKELEALGFLFVSNENAVLNSDSATAFTQDVTVPELFAFNPRAKLYDCPLVTSGALILQDKGSCLAAAALLDGLSEIFHGDDNGKTPVILDACAAPGNKSLHAAHLASRRAVFEKTQVANNPVVVAVERDATRFNLLCERVAAHAGSEWVLCLNADFLAIRPNHEALANVTVRAILLDPSCSGSGMRSRSDIGSDRPIDVARLQRLCAFQKTALVHALCDFPDALRVYVGVVRLFYSFVIKTLQSCLVVPTVSKSFPHPDCELQRSAYDFSFLPYEISG